MKRLLSAVLALVMMFTLIPLGVVTASAETLSGTTGDCTWTLVDGVLTISGNGAMADYSYSDKAPWGNYYSQIKEIIVENGVTSIGEFAFDGCERTKKVTVADSVQEIKRYAFYDGWLIMDLYLGNGVKKIGERAFDYSGETSEGEYRQLIIYYRGTKNHKEQIAIAEPGFEGLCWWEYVIDETLIKEDDGKWYYYICGRKENANTLVKFKDKWFYVENGVWNKNYTGLFEYKEKTFYIKNGKWDSSITAVVKINGEWFGIKNGKLFEFGGLIKYKGKWFYIEDGKWDKKITGIIRYDLKHFYVENGKWAKKTLLCKYNDGGSWGEYEWCYVKNGVWEYEPDTEQLVKYKGKWFYIENSYWNKSATMLFKYKGKWLYIEDGKWSKKRLIFSYKNQYFYIKDGIAQLDFSGYINIYGTRLKITNGKLK